MSRSNYMPYWPTISHHHEQVHGNVQQMSTKIVVSVLPCRCCHMPVWQTRGKDRVVWPISIRKCRRPSRPQLSIPRTSCMRYGFSMMPSNPGTIRECVHRGALCIGRTLWWNRRLWGRNDNMVLTAVGDFHFGWRLQNFFKWQPMIELTHCLSQFLEQMSELHRLILTNTSPIT